MAITKRSDVNPDVPQNDPDSDRTTARAAQVVSQPETSGKVKAAVEALARAVGEENDVSGIGTDRRPILSVDVLDSVVQVTYKDEDAGTDFEPVVIRTVRAGR